MLHPRTRLFVRQRRHANSRCSLFVVSLACSCCNSLIGWILTVSMNRTSGDIVMCDAMWFWCLLALANLMNQREADRISQHFDPTVCVRREAWIEVGESESRVAAYRTFEERQTQDCDTSTQEFAWYAKHGQRKENQCQNLQRACLFHIVVNVFVLMQFFVIVQVIISYNCIVIIVSFSFSSSQVWCKEGSLAGSKRHVVLLLFVCWVVCIIDDKRWQHGTSPFSLRGK